MSRKTSTWQDRKQERVLLTWAGMAVLTAYLMPMAARWAHVPVFQWQDWLPLAGYVLSLFVAHAWFVTTRFAGDRILFPTVLFLAGLGMVVQVRMGTLAFDDPSAWAHFALPAGFVVALVVTGALKKGRVNRLEGLTMASLAVSVLLLGAVLVLGSRFRGAVYLAGGINPTEFIKPFMAIFLAGFITLFGKDFANTVAGVPAPSFRAVLTFAVLWGMPMALLVLQRDLGLILLLNITLLLLLVMATGRWGYLLLGIGGCLLLGVAVFLFFPHGKARFDVWLEPFADPTGKGWQILQGLSAMFSGGWWGTGLGTGSPTVIPIAASDFIYAAMGEELGIVGCGILMILYLVVFYRGFAIADHQPAGFGRHLAAALTMLLAVQTLMNIGGVTKAIPVTGITLPFISHGGSSLVSSFLMIGMLLALSDPATGRAKGSSRKSRRRKR